MPVPIQAQPSYPAEHMAPQPLVLTTPPKHAKRFGHRKLREMLAYQANGLMTGRAGTDGRNTSLLRHVALLQLDMIGVNFHGAPRSRQTCQVFRHAAQSEITSHSKDGFQ